MLVVNIMPALAALLSVCALSAPAAAESELVSYSPAALPGSSCPLPRKPGLQPVSLSEFVERGSEKASGFVTLKWGPPRLVMGAGPRRVLVGRRGLSALNQGMVRGLSALNQGMVAGIQRVGFDPDKPFGERTTYLVTFKDGSTADVKDSPLVFDLDGQGIRTSGAVSQFDIAAGRKLDSLRGVAAGVGVLVFDADKDGVSGASGLELFGNFSDVDGDHKPDGFADGFQALAALAAKAVREGVLGAEVVAAGRLDGQALSRLEQYYGLKMKVGGLSHLAVPLRTAGVAAIALSDRPVQRREDFDGQGNDLLVQEGAVFTRADGSQGSYADIWFSYRPRKASPAPMRLRDVGAGSGSLVAHTGSGR